MTSATDAIFEAALSLPSETRAALAERLLESLDTVDEHERARIDEAWAEESESRLQAYKDGRIDAVPGDEVLNMLRSGRSGDA